jgi:tripartite-type tricarboxylate transporter receptor subunit TctC
MEARMLCARFALAIMLAVGMLAIGKPIGLPGAAEAQSFPDKPIKLVAPFPAGGPTDTTARIVAQALSARLGQTVIIENQAGAGGTIGAKQVATAAPDGYTLLMVAVASTFGTAPVFYKLDYDPVKAFAPVATIVVDKLLMVGGPALPAQTVQEVVNYAKANPGKLNYGAPTGIGPHFMMELFKRKVGIDIVHISYRGLGPVIPDLIGGQVHLTISGESVLLPFVQGRDARVRPLAVTGPQRWPELPDIPTLVEKSYLDVPYDSLFGIVAPAGTPAPVIAKLNAAINDGLRASDTKANFAKLGIDPVITTPAEFAAIIAKEGPLWADIIRVTGVKPE